MTLYEWADDNGIRLPPPNDKGAVCVADIECLDTESKGKLRRLDDYFVCSRSRSTWWLKPRVDNLGARTRT